MSSQQPSTGSALTKMQHAYWETKQTFTKSFGIKEDSCIILSDSDLDTRLQLLQAADCYFNQLMSVLVKYKQTLKQLMDSQENLGTALIEYGIKDSTAAGKLMLTSGKALTKTAQRHMLTWTAVTELHHEVQTFQFKATSDAMQTITRMEKSRRAYRSGLMWLKNESVNLDPDVAKRIKKFRRVQAHLKHLKVRFDKAKLETMQKIDLYLMSRGNLFSKTLVPYREALCKVSKYTSKLMDSVTCDIPFHLNYSFQAVKELNMYSKMSLNNLYFQPDLKRCKKKSTNRCNGKLKEHAKPDEVGDFSPQTDDPDASKTHSVDEDCQISSNTEALLIDLSSDNSKKSKSEPRCKQSSSNYASDLVLLNLANSQNGNKYCSSNIDSECENCLEMCDSLTNPCNNQTYSDEVLELNFWDLMNNLELKRTTSPPPEHTCKQDTVLNPQSSVSNLTTILDEFDPFGKSEITDC